MRFQTINIDCIIEINNTGCERTSNLGARGQKYPRPGKEHQNLEPKIGPHSENNI